MSSQKQVAFLGYDATQTALVDVIRQNGHEVELHQDPVNDLSAYDAVISFGYRHILKPDTLATAKRPVINLHIAYLPYNRGAHPNFWSWIDGTPAGVTLHEIDPGIDTGPIVAQREMQIEPEGLTFRETYEMLYKEIEALFLDHCSDILDNTYKATPQTQAGTYHRVADLPDWMNTWDMPITDAIARYHNDQ